MPLTNETLKLVLLGGVGEIGRNMMLFEYGPDMVMVDAGLMFPENDLLGIDVVIPDISYVLQNKEKLRGIIITHGHADHIGALPYLLQEVRAPIYATYLTQGLIRVKLEEWDLTADQVETVTIHAGDALELGPFHIEFFHVSHSIPDGVGLAIDTPVGLVVHSGDFKFDYSPVDGQRTDFAKLAELGERGVLLLLSDSTNAESYGYTPSERTIGESFDALFGEAPGRIIVATFASNISRVQQVVNAAAKRGRKLAVVGRSMEGNVRMALELGYLKVPEGMLISIQEANRLPGGEVAIICTGAQGEPTSALVRIATGEHRQVGIRKGDTVIVSSTPIPGNEELINRTINMLFRLGADVKYHELADVHVSGHASQEELKLMMSLIKPRYFIPIHGEYRHLLLHARLAEQAGVPPENILVAESGQVLELDGETVRVVGNVGGGLVLVDGLGVGDVGDVVLRDRQHLAQDGFLVVVLVLGREKGELLAGPDIISRGFVYMRDSEELIADAKERVMEEVRRTGTEAKLSRRLRQRLAQLFYERTGRRPIILPVVMEI